MNLLKCISILLFVNTIHDGKECFVLSPTSPSPRFPSYSVPLHSLIKQTDLHFAEMIDQQVIQVSSVVLHCCSVSVHETQERSFLYCFLLQGNLGGHKLHALELNLVNLLMKNRKTIHQKVSAE